MRKLLFFVWLTQLLFICCACNAEKEVVENNTLTTTAAPTAEPVQEKKLDSLTVGSEESVKQKISSLANPEEGQTIQYYKLDTVIFAVICENDVELLPNGSINGQGNCCIVAFDMEKEEILLTEKRVCGNGFQAACFYDQQNFYLPIICRNDYCGVEFYDMSVFRVENGEISEGQISGDSNSLILQQNYKPVLTEEGNVELYCRATITDSFINELLEDTGLYYFDTVQSKSQEYSNRYSYDWKPECCVSLTEMDFSKERNALLQSRIFADIVDVCLEPLALTPTWTEGDLFYGLTCSTPLEEAGWQLVVCKQLGTSAVSGMQNIAVLVYDEQGRNVAYDYFMADEVRVICDKNEIHVFAGYNQQGYVETIVDGTVFWNNQNISYHPIANLTNVP